MCDPYVLLCDIDACLYPVAKKEWSPGGKSLQRLRKAPCHEGDLIDAAWVGRVIRPHATSADRDQPRCPQHLEVMRDCWLADVEAIDDVARADRLLLRHDE